MIRQWSTEEATRTCPVCGHSMEEAFDGHYCSNCARMYWPPVNLDSAVAAWFVATLLVVVVVAVALAL